jgi:hypothetical protein
MDDLAIAVAKKTGDYSVLSHADICVVALTYELDLQEEIRRIYRYLSYALPWRIYAERRSGRTGSRSRGCN